MTTAFILAATIVLVVGLFAVIVERTNERDEARYERDQLERECDEHAVVSADLSRRLAAYEPANERHLYAVDSPIHDDLAVEQLRTELNDEWIGRMHGWGIETDGAS